MITAEERCENFAVMPVLGSADDDRRSRHLEEGTGVSRVERGSGIKRGGRADKEFRWNLIDQRDRGGEELGKVFGCTGCGENVGCEWKVRECSVTRGAERY